jgi:transcriptional regulator with XRE-family HTH domain
LERKEQMKGRLDVAALFASLDAARLDRGVTWRHVAKQAGVSQSTLTRLGQGHRPDIDGALALTRWLGLNLEHFERDGAGHPVRPAPPVAEVVALLRADRSLSPEGREMLARLLQSAYTELRKD